MPDFKSTEEKVLKLWEDQDVFRKSVEQRAGKKPFVFFEGPPTANGMPHLGHFLTRMFKDVICRFQTMRGRYVLRKGGWDTHGLPVEIEVEKALGFTNKKEVEAYGIAAYNKKCRESVWKYKAEWEAMTRRMGCWLDMQHPYITYENSYIESLWNIIGRIAEKDLLYQAHRVVPFCTRCGTPLSSHEVAQGYKKVTENSVYLKFKIKKSALKLPKGTFILAWTTTPWTLPGNVALAVREDIRYVLVKKIDEHFILAKDLAEHVLGAPYDIEQEFSGKELVGTAYEPLFAIKAMQKPAAYHVYAADFVTTADGTGVVHIAPMYGEDDYRLGAREKLPTVHTVDEQGHFIGVSKELNGKYVKSREVEQLVTQHLMDNGNFLKSESYEHDYPFCWRCGTPLLYYAKDSWFIRTSAVNSELLANNETVNWIPAHLKEGRFGQWLREAKDWNLSRERYWGTPLPVWRSEDKKETLVVSSLADLETHRATKPATFWVMRHAEAQRNVDHIINTGATPSPLTDHGKEQVVAAAERLQGETFAAIITSPLQRAKETADIVAKTLGIKKVIVDERLAEYQLGPSMEGKTEEEYLAAYPTYESRFLQQPPGGETLFDLKARVWSALQELNETYAGKQVLLVSHEYPIWMMADAANGWSMQESIAEKEKRGDDFAPLVGVEKIVVRNLPRNERGELDMHRPYIDDIVLKRNGTGPELHRIPELCDVWFDSGSMPYAQWHWPFENEETFKQQFPADFIVEGVDQTRGWFYTLLTVATLLGKGAPYKNVMSLGFALDEKGQKMSKSKGNGITPNELMDRVGVDAARWYFYTVNAPGDDKLFVMRDAEEKLKGFMGTLENCMRFSELYDSEHRSEHVEKPSTHLLDQWLRSRLHRLIAFVDDRLEHYEPAVGAREIERFVVDDLSQWWLRRSRKRADAFPLLKEALRTLALLSAPFIPFTAEDLWQRLGEGNSVHLADWPAAGASMIDEALEQQMVSVREHISAGLALRKQHQIKVRQPLQSVAIPGDKLHPDLEALIKEELNVKEVRYVPGKPVELDLNIGSELRAEGFAREAMRAIQDMRKEAGCRVGDKVRVQWSAEDSGAADALTVHADMIMQGTGLSAFVRQADTGSMTIEKDIELAPGVALHLGILT